MPIVRFEPNDRSYNRKISATRRNLGEIDDRRDRRRFWSREANNNDGDDDDRADAIELDSQTRTR